MSKYTTMTLDALREQGCITGNVERFIAQAGVAIPVKGNPHLRKRTGIRKDLFGIIDLIALRPINPKNNWCGFPWEMVGVQSFGADYAEHKRKVLSSKVAPIWLASGAAIELWGWRKVLKEKGSKVKVWKPRMYRFERGDFQNVPPTPVEEAQLSEDADFPAGFLDISDAEIMINSL